MADNQPMYTEAELQRIKESAAFEGTVLQRLFEIDRKLTELSSKLESKADKSEITSWNTLQATLEKRVDILEDAKGKIIGAMFILGLLWPILSGLLLDFVKRKFF